MPGQPNSSNADVVRRLNDGSRRQLTIAIETMADDIE